MSSFKDPHKRSRLLDAVKQNEVSVLKDLLDSPEWYTTVRDWDGASLLEVAIHTNSVAVFNYMLSIPDFPKDIVNRDDYHTPLLEALSEETSRNGEGEHFAYELIKKGASLDVTQYVSRHTPLILAIERRYTRVAILLIEKGVDINRPNRQRTPPLELAIYRNVYEVFSALLIHGATPALRVFEQTVNFNLSFLVEEMFFYVFDEHSEYEVSLQMIVQYVKRKLPLLDELSKCRLKVRIEDDSLDSHYFGVLSRMKFDSFKIVIEKFGTIIRNALANCSNCSIINHEDKIFLDNIDFMLENGFRNEVLLGISTFDSFEVFHTLLDFNSTESSTMKQYCYLLSYGLTISELDLQLIYQQFGYCELFKILLHMDIKVGYTRRRFSKWIMPTLIYDVTTDLDIFFMHLDEYSTTSLKELNGYFVHPKLKVLTASTSEVSNSPEIPLLVELARNAFRKYFVKLFRIETSRKFYTLLNSLPISVTYKKIISYETKLY